MTGPRILTIDIETRPPLVWSWGLFKANIGIDQVKEPGGTFAFAAKWHDFKKIEWRSDFHDGHEEMVHRAYDLLDQADILVHYNGKKFDVPHLQTEFKRQFGHQPSPFRQVDLLRSVKAMYRLPSYKLDFVLQYFGLGQKVDHEGFMLWRKCMEGDPKAWADMRKYGMHDTRMEEKLYDFLGADIIGHPHMGLYTPDGEDRCGRCGSTEGQYRGYAYTEQRAYRKFRCVCGKWRRKTRMEFGVDSREVRV